MMSDQFFAYDSSIVAPLSRVPVWPYTLHHLMPHKCHGNKENCPSRSHQVWELPINELDRRSVMEGEDEACVNDVSMYLYLSVVYSTDFVNLFSRSMSLVLHFDRRLPTCPATAIPGHGIIFPGQAADKTLQPISVT